MYEITINRKQTIIKPASPEWVVLGTEEVDRDERYYRHQENEPKTRIKDVMGYAPAIDKPHTESIEILKQTVDELDLAAVIKAINNL